MLDNSNDESKRPDFPTHFVIGGVLLLFIAVANGKYLALFSLLSSFGFSFIGLVLATSLSQRIFGVMLSGLSGGLCAIIAMVYLLP
jgi:hypothetical protein